MAERFELDTAALDRLPPDQRRQALLLLKAQHEAHKNNPLWRFDPLDAGGSGVAHTKQHEWMLAHHTADGAPTKHRIFLGGNRSGKSTAGIVADIIDCCDLEAVPPHLRKYKRWHIPIKMFLVVVDNRIAETVAIPKLKEWCPKDQLVGGSFARAYNKELNRLHFKNGSWIQVMTQRMETDAFSGADLHRVHFDEEPLYEHGRAVYGECFARLTDHNGDMLITMTPLLGMTWLYDELYLPWQRQVGEEVEDGMAVLDTGPCYISLVDMDDNPTLDAVGRKSTEASFRTDEERQARKKGRFVSFAGRVYQEYEPSKHVLPDADVLEHFHGELRQMLVVGLDPGFRHMAGVVWIALDHDGVWVGAELGLKETIIKDVAQAIHFKNHELGVVPDLYPTDPAVLKRDPQTGKSDQLAYLEAGIPAVPATNDVRPGINVIRDLLKRDRLHIASSCTVLREQMVRYRWMTPKRAENDPAEKPVKKDDHILDALRYGIMALPLPRPVEEVDSRPMVERMIDLEQKQLRRRGRGTPSSLGPGFFAA